MGRLTGKVALVTGGGRGIGRGIALELAREGADLAINYRRNREAAEATANDVRALGREADVAQADVGDSEAVLAMVAHVIGRFGHLDVVVANSGVASRFQTVADLDPAEWRRVMTTDLDGAFYTARATVPHLIASRGTLIFISSIGADAAAAGGAPYHCAKAGVNTLTKVLAKEMAPHGVRVNAIAPGLVHSDMGDRLLKAFGNDLIRAIPLARAGEPADIGRAAAFLASADASWITGKILRVDGGAYM
ncbi:MAG TPA: glucose 1-dehydrogenase [Candidatus Limnocylindria bacterium]|nr:glucose 1-dehydrogenase [Candidatus Limnocylindria bacterium]